MKQLLALFILRDWWVVDTKVLDAESSEQRRQLQGHPQDADFDHWLLYIDPPGTPEFDSWLQVVDSKEEKIATTNGSSQWNQALTAFGVELGWPREFWIQGCVARFIAARPLKLSDRFLFQSKPNCCFLAKRIVVFLVDILWIPEHQVIRFSCFW